MGGVYPKKARNAKRIVVPPAGTKTGDRCPRCKRGKLYYDCNDREWICLNCGWRS